MAKDISVKGGIIIDFVKDLNQKIGMPVKKGKISKIRDNYYFIVDKKQMLLPVGTLISLTEIKPLVGKEVFGVFSAKNKINLVAIDTVPLPEKPIPWKRGILCYIPPPDIINFIKDEIRKPLLRELLKQKIITPEFVNSIGQLG